jgi:hypothetical protein
MRNSLGWQLALLWLLGLLRLLLGWGWGCC